MRDLLVEVLELQTHWSNANTPEMRRRGVLIRQEIPVALRAHRAALSRLMGPVGGDLEVEGRDGTGQKSEIPWVRLYSQSRSPSASEGWYCVYLFRRDGAGVYLCLGQAGTRNLNGDFRPRLPEDLAALVVWAKEILGDDLKAQKDLAPQITLHGQSKLGDAYERGTVCCKYYDVAALPDESLLVQDLAAFMRLLRKLYDADDLGCSPDNPEPEVRAAEKLAGAVAAPLRFGVQKGQGFGLTQEERCSVERHAMEVAQKHLNANGYVLEDVSRSRPYDFIARKDGKSIVVEVKGTTGILRSIILTKNEVALHQAHHPSNSLIVVHSIKLDRGRKPSRASGGILYELSPWAIDGAALQPLSFQYTLLGAVKI